MPMNYTPPEISLIDAEYHLYDKLKQYLLSHSPLYKSMAEVIKLDEYATIILKIILALDNSSIHDRARASLQLLSILNNIVICNNRLINLCSEIR